MKQQNIYVNYQGFHPSDFTRSYLSDKLNRLYEFAPYGSNLEAAFSRNGQLFKGMVMIRSKAGRFFASATGSRLKDVTHRLNDQIKHQLNKWKSKRFKTSGLASRGVTYDSVSEIESSA